MDGITMTMLASWIGIDTHGPTSAYIMSDSRISWGDNNTFDHGKKVFACKNYPEIFGYAGDVLFPSIVLQQIVEMIDSDLLFDKKTSCYEKNKIIFDKLSYEICKYPLNHSANIFHILHVSRETVVTKERYPNYYANLLCFDNGCWNRKSLDIPNESGLIYTLGSGSKEFKKNYVKYQNDINKNTTRNVFHCFIDSLINTKDPSCGGAPQLVSIYRKPNTYARYTGIIYNNKRYFAGSEIPVDSDFNNIEWRNENFERCDGKTKQIIEGAQPQPNPLLQK